MTEGAELGDMLDRMVILFVELLYCFSIGNFEEILSRDDSGVSSSSSGEQLRRFFMVEECCFKRQFLNASLLSQFYEFIIY